MNRRIFAGLFVAAFVFALVGRAEEPAKIKTPTASTTPAPSEAGDKLTDKQITNDAANQHEVLAKKFQDLKDALLRMKHTLEESSDPEDRKKAILLGIALKKIDSEAITTKFDSLVELLKTSKELNVDQLRTARDKNQKLASDLRIILDIIINGEAKVDTKPEQQRLEKLIEDIKRLYREQGMIRAKLERGKTDKEENLKDQSKITQETEAVQRSLGKDNSGGEAGKAGKPGENKGEGKPGDGKGEGKNDTGKDGKGSDKNPKGEGKNDSAKDNKDNKADGAKGDPKDNKGDGSKGEGARGDPKDNKGDGSKGEGAQGNKSDAKGQGSEGNPKSAGKGEGAKGDPKDNKGDPKNEGAKSGDPKDNKGDAKNADPKEGSKGDAKNAGSPGSKSEGSQGSKSEGSQGSKSEGSQGSKSEGSQGNKGEGSQADKGDKDANPGAKKDEGPNSDKQSKILSKPETKKPEDPKDPKPAEAKGAGDKNDPKSGNQAGNKSDSKGKSENKAEAKGQQSPQQGSQQSPNQQAGGQPSQSKGQGQQSPQGGQQQPGGSKSGPQQPQQPNNDSQNAQNEPGRKQIQDAIEAMNRAKENIAKNDKEKASGEQSKAMQELKKAQEKLEELLKQLRHEEIERILADLQRRFEQMLGMQIDVRDKTVDVAKKVEGNGNKPGTAEKSESLTLSRKEEEIVVLANKAIDMLLSDGTAVAFPAVLLRVRDDMTNVQRRLLRADVGPVTVAIENDIIDSLKEMVDAVKQARKDNTEKQQNPQQNKPPSGQQQPQDRSLINILAELKMIRSMEVRVFNRTVTYAKSYPEAVEQLPHPEQITDPAQRETVENIARELLELARFQMKIKDITKKVGTGEGKPNQ